MKNNKGSLILLLSVGALLASCQGPAQPSNTSESSNKSESSSLPASSSESSAESRPSSESSVEPSLPSESSESSASSDPIDERAPVYQGMTIAKVDEEIPTRGLMPRYTKSGSDERTHDDEIESSIDDITGIEIHESSETEYFVNPGDPFIVEVHLSNPHDYEIQSFTLNGEKYSSYMFEDGSTMELLRLKVTAPNEPGLKDYTIDAIKYIDGTEIKDVRMSGEKTIKAGFTYPDAPVATVNVTPYSTSMSFSVDVSDSWNRIVNGTLHFYLTDGRSIILDQPLSLGHVDIDANSLRMSTAYQYGVTAVYDLLDGEGLHSVWLAKDTILTNTAVSISITDKGKDYISFESTIDYSASIQDIVYSLYDKDSGNLVDSLTYAGTFNNLLSDHDYVIYADYGYYSGNRTYSDWTLSEVIHTGKKAAPSLFVNGLVMGTSASYFLTIVDEDNVAWVDSVSVCRKDTTDALWSRSDGLANGVFTSLYTGTEFDLIAKIAYDYNDGKGTHSMEAKWSFSTEGRTTPKARLSSVTADSNSISYSIATDDGDDAFNEYRVELYDGDEIVATSYNIRDTFTGLTPDHDYEVRAECIYDMCDGTGPQSISLSRTIRTWNRQMPWFYVYELKQVGLMINYSIGYYDADNSLLSYDVRLLKDGEQVGEPISATNGTFSDLESSGGYTLRITYRYDLGYGEVETYYDTYVEYDAEINMENDFTYEVRKENNVDVAIVRGYYGEETSFFRIPDTLGGYPVVGIGYEAFANFEWLKDVVIPETVTFIEEGAFYWCTGLESINIPVGVKKIHYRTFWAIFDIKNIYYGGNERQWGNVDHSEDIGLEFYWGVLHFYSENEPTRTGDFWHYVDDVPTAWDKYEGSVDPENPVENLTLYWDDVVVDGSDSLWDNNGKLGYDATYSFAFYAEKAGEVTMYWTMKGSNGNGDRIVGVDSMGFSITCNEEEGVVIPMGLTYEEYFGADFESYQEIDFATFTVSEGENIVTIRTDNQSHRPSVDASSPIRLIYK